MKRFPANLSALFLVPACALLCQCTHQPTAPAQARVEWRVIGREPLTYAPKGYAPPAPDNYDSVTASYVYLMDRQTRYYVPWNHPEAKRQALLAREASKTRADKCHEQAGALADGTLRMGVWTLYAAVVVAGAMAGVSPNMSP